MALYIHMEQDEVEELKAQLEDHDKVAIVIETENTDVGLWSVYKVQFDNESNSVQILIG